MLTQSPEARQKERDLDFYTRLFQAGIGVASGSSRNALENLKEAQPAIAGFASDIAKQREEDRSRIKDLAALGLKREEFGMELKKLGLTEKQINAVSKHYEDWNRHNTAMEGLEKQKIGVHQQQLALSKLQGNDIKTTREIDNMFKTLSANPKNMTKSEDEIYAMAKRLVTGQGGVSGPVGSWTPQGGYVANKG
jgi:hypothetical protein